MIKFIRNFFQSNIAAEGAGATPGSGGTSGQLVRNEAYSKTFEHWKTSGKADTLLRDLYKNFLNGEPAPESALQIDMHVSPGANGFSVKKLMPVGSEQFRFIMDLLREKIETLQYRLYSSTFEENSRGDKLIRFERHYLKPGLSTKQPPMEQLYGNILIELEMTNGEADYLKLLATHYTGFDYKPAGNFDELVRLLLG